MRSRQGEEAVLGQGHQPDWSRPEGPREKLVISEPVFATGNIFLCPS